MENSLVNINSLHNINLISKIWKGYKLNSILLEDELHAEQKQKTEDFGDYILFMVKMFHNNLD